MSAYCYPQKRLSINSLQQMKVSGEKIAALTAYDASFAALVDQAGIDWVLVGDSLGNVIQGRATTIPVTIDDMVYHTQCVARQVNRAYLAADMPFLTYSNIDAALHNAARLMQQGGAQMVKLECDISHLGLVEKMVNEGISVCVHLGLRPQMVEKMGGYKIQGRNQSSAQILQQAAAAFVDIGVNMLLLESVPASLGALISQNVSVPVIGIGAGVDCDGQILVLYDMLGITLGPVPTFAKNFLMNTSVPEAIRLYIKSIKSGAFPEPQHWFTE